MKKINLLTVALLAYLLVMAYIGWPGRQGGNHLSYTEYFIATGATAAAIFLLRYLRIRLLKMRNRRKGNELH